LEFILVKISGVRAHVVFFENLAFFSCYIDGTALANGCIFLTTFQNQEEELFVPQQSNIGQLCTIVRYHNDLIHQLTVRDDSEEKQDETPVVDITEFSDRATFTNSTGCRTHEGKMVCMFACFW
jgi:hypothetical protein